MAFFTSRVPNRSSYSGSNQYVNEIVWVSDEFLKVAGKSRPTPEERFNAMLSFTAIVAGYSCVKYVVLKNFDATVVASEVRSLLADMMVNPVTLSQNEMERHLLQTNLNSKFQNASHYPGDAVASLLFTSRFKQFANGIQHADFLSFPGFARDYALLMIKAYTQEPLALMELDDIVFSFLFGIRAGH
jgi:hypothetical protein